MLAKHHYFTEKRNSMSVRESEILLDSTIPFKALGNEEMKNPDKKGNIWAVDAKNAVFRGTLM